MLYCTCVVQWASTSRNFPAVLHMFSDLAVTLACLHDAGITHRDVRRTHRCVLEIKHACPRVRANSSSELHAYTLNC